MTESDFDAWLTEHLSDRARQAMAEGRLAKFALVGYIPEVGQVRGLCERIPTGLLLRGTKTTPCGQEPFAEDMTWETFARTVEVGSIVDHLIHLDLDWATSLMTMEITPLDVGHLQGWLEAMEANGIQIATPGG